MGLIAAPFLIIGFLAGLVAGIIQDIILILFAYKVTKQKSKDNPNIFPIWFVSSVAASLILILFVPIGLPEPEAFHKTGSFETLLYIGFASVYNFVAKLGYGFIIGSSWYAFKQKDHNIIDPEEALKKLEK